MLFEVMCLNLNLPSSSVVIPTRIDLAAISSTSRVIFEVFQLITHVHKLSFELLTVQAFLMLSISSALQTLMSELLAMYSDLEIPVIMQNYQIAQQIHIYSITSLCIIRSSNLGRNLATRRERIHSTKRAGILECLERIIRGYTFPTNISAIDYCISFMIFTLCVSMNGFM